MEAATTNIDDLKGDALDAALDGADLLDGNKSKSVDEKRALLREHEEALANAGNVSVKVQWPVTSLDTGIEGVGTINFDNPTPVSKNQLDAVKEAAASADVVLIVGRG
jgi:hypothetical protein